MDSTSFTRIAVFLGLALSAQGAGLCSVSGQTVAPAVREAYFRAVGEHFQAPFQEVSLLAEWELAPDEIPVVLFLAGRAGVSPDALVGLRRGGQGWMQVATRFGVGAQAFHIPLPEDAPLGMLARAFGEFRGTDSRRWDRIRLQDAEIVALVNLRVLSQAAAVTPIRVLQCREEAGSFVACFPRLRGR